MPLLTRFRAWQHGFTSTSYQLYLQEGNGVADYLPDAARFDQARAEGRFGSILHDKLQFNAIVGLHARVPMIVALIARGHLITANSDHPVSDVTSLLEYCEGRRGVIVKPVAGNKGRRVQSLVVAESRVLLSGRVVDRRAVDDLVGGLDGYIVTDYIQQAAYAAAIFPHSANTLRVITMRDPDRGHEPFIPVAVHRFGVRDSVPTDNVSNGGLAAKINPATGELAPAKRYGPGLTSGNLDCHPETGQAIAGVKVRSWVDVQRTMLELTRSLPFLTFVGWDVIVTDDGCVVIEGNNPPDRSIQREYPFLADSRVRRFFEYHGAL